MLEVINKGSGSDAHPVPLLFVHGANHAAWCWDEHFLDFFADKGYRALAVNLRGHGRSPTSKPLRKCLVADYVDDVASVADTLETRPVIIGHSWAASWCRSTWSHTTRPPACWSHRSPRWICWGVITQDETPPMAFDKVCHHRQTVARTEHAQACPRSLLLRSHTRVPGRALRHAASGRELERPPGDGVSNRLKPERVTTPLLVLGAESDGASHRTKCAQRHVHIAPKPNSSPTWATTCCSNPGGLMSPNESTHGSKRVICGACDIGSPAASVQRSQNGWDAMPTTAASKSNAIT